MAVNSTAQQVVAYYTDTAKSYTATFDHACHFGYTPTGTTPFKLVAAVRAMEIKLGQTLNLPAGSRVLDAGSGYGQVAVTLAALFGLQVTGIDLTGFRAVEARRYANHSGVGDRVHIVQGSYQVLPFPDNTFDAVYTMETLCHADSLGSALSEFLRVLKPGGRLVLHEYTIPRINEVGWLRRKISEHVVAQTGMASIVHFVHGSFPSLLAAAGFESAQAEDITTFVYPTWRHLFWRSVRRDWHKVLTGRVLRYPNSIGGLLIYPNRHRLGYVIATATKPV